MVLQVKQLPLLFPLRFFLYNFLDLLLLVFPIQILLLIALVFLLGPSVQTDLDLVFLAFLLCHPLVYMLHIHVQIHGMLLL